MATNTAICHNYRHFKFHVHFLEFTSDICLLAARRIEFRPIATGSGTPFVNRPTWYFCKTAASARDRYSSGLSTTFGTGHCKAFPSPSVRVIALLSGRHKPFCRSSWHGVEAQLGLRETSHQSVHPRPVSVASPFGAFLQPTSCGPVLGRRFRLRGYVETQARMSACNSLQCHVKSSDYLYVVLRTGKSILRSIYLK